MIGNQLVLAEKLTRSIILSIAIENNKSKIIEYWGFDCLYGDYQQEGWLKWARKNPYKLLYIYLPYHKRARELMFRNISVAGLEILYAKKNEHVKTQLKKSYKDPHYWVPITYWRDRLSRLSWGWGKTKG